jgi:hypothetical protein
VYYRPTQQFHYLKQKNSFVFFNPAIEEQALSFSFFSFPVTAFIFRLAHDGAQAPLRVLRLLVP